MKIGCQTLTWANYSGDYDVKKVIRKVGEIGFDGIEFIEPLSKLGSAESFKKVLDETGLAIASLSCNLNMELMDTSDIEETNKRVKFAGALGVKDIILCGGWRSNGIKKEDSAYKILAEKLDTCSKYAAGLNMNIAFHPHKDTIVETREDIEKLLQFTDKPKLCLDIAHLAACGDDPAELIKIFRDIITYMHLKDWDAKKRDFVELGKGGLDIKACLSALEEIGYNGWAVVELDRTSRTPEESAIINANYLRLG